jgi:predicted metal-dependent phosphoesterase TrpH
MKMDLHIHSKYSYDSFTSPLKILKTAKKKGLDAISITDHDAMKIDYKQFRNADVIIIPGMEIKTDMGDIIGLFLTEKIQNNDFLSVIDEIRNQEGVVVLPHPYRRDCDPASLISYVDLVEVLNARSRDCENKCALKLSEKFSKKIVSGSDAHNFMEIGNVITEIPGYYENTEDLRKCILTSERKCYGNSPSYYISHGYSFIIGKMKRVLH